jgi:hypothetical protein
MAEAGRRFLFRGQNKLPTNKSFLVLAFAQLKWRESLQDIETELGLKSLADNRRVRKISRASANFNFPRWHSLSLPSGDVSSPR